MHAVVIEIYHHVINNTTATMTTPVYDGQSIHDYRFMQFQNKITIA